MKQRLLDRSAIWLPFHYCLFTSEKDYFKWLKSGKIPRDQWGDFVPNGKGASTHFWRIKDGKVVVVCIDGKAKRKPIQIYSLLFHEAVHIWQELVEDIGEKQPSDEFMAYSIQWIGQQLCFEFDRQISRKRK